MRTVISKLLLVSALVFLFAVPSFALEAIVHVSYTHPSTSVDGTPLTDLAYSVVTFKDVDGNVIGEPYQHTASTPAGGDDVSLDLPVDVPPNTQTMVTIEVSAFDLSAVANESPKASIGHSITPPDTLPPGQVTNIVVTSTTTTTTTTIVP